MSERIVFRQDRNYQVEFQASDPREPDDDQVASVSGLHEVTPYGMMLFSLASCTAQVVLTYAEHHQIPLQEVELDLRYMRIFEEDCENCENIDRYREEIHERIEFFGNLSEGERKKLFRIAHQCPIHKMFEDGIDINSEFVS